MKKILLLSIGICCVIQLFPQTPNRKYVWLQNIQPNDPLKKGWGLPDLNEGFTGPPFALAADPNNPTQDDIAWKTTASPGYYGWKWNNGWANVWRDLPYYNTPQNISAKDLHNGEYKGAVLTTKEEEKENPMLHPGQTSSDQYPVKKFYTSSYMSYNGLTQPFGYYESKIKNPYSRFMWPAMHYNKNLNC